MRNDFAVLILSHGRADRVYTIPTLRKGGYTGKVYIVVDNEDEQQDEYIARYGKENVIVFDKLEATLNAWCKRTYKQTFSEVYKIYAQDGKVSLRRMQFNLAKKSPAMAIFLGKNMLGQSDEPTIENNDAAVASANAQITALADLIRNPQPNRTMDDVTGQEDGTP